VLDRLERDDEVDAARSDRNRRDGRLGEREVSRRIGRTRVRDRRAVDVHADDVDRHLREKRAAVALSAGRVEHAPSRREPPRERVAMHVLVDDLAGDAGDEPFAGEFEFCGYRHAVSTAATRPRRF
jgi:hypothetical protein